MRRGSIAAIALISATACGGHGGGSQATTAPSPHAVATLLIDAKGVTMPLSIAERTLRFRPFLPPGQIVQSAVIPPLNVDQQKNHGLAIEYVANGSAYVLSQWPRARFNVPPAALSAGACAPVPYKTGGFIWNTRNDVVMTVQADGQAEPSRVEREARRLLRRGACEEAATTPRRPLRSRAAFWPRQSAS